MRAPLTLKLVFSYVLVLGLCAVPSLLRWPLQSGVVFAAAASVALLFGLLVLTQIAVPLLRASRDLAALQRGEYNPPPRRVTNDEVGDVLLGEVGIRQTADRGVVEALDEDHGRAREARQRPRPDRLAVGDVVLHQGFQEDLRALVEAGHGCDFDDSRRF